MRASTAVVVLAGIVIAAPVAAAQAVDRGTAACGAWRTADEEGLVHIFRAANGTLAGKIIGASRVDRDGKNLDACNEPKEAKPPSGGAPGNGGTVPRETSRVRRESRPGGISGPPLTAHLCGNIHVS